MLKKINFANFKLRSYTIVIIDLLVISKFFGKKTIIILSKYFLQITLKVLSRFTFNVYKYINTIDVKFILEYFFPS